MDSIDKTSLSLRNINLTESTSSNVRKLLAKRLLSDPNLCMYQKTISGTLNIPIEDIFKILTDNKLIKVFQGESYSIFKSNDTIVDVNHYKSNKSTTIAVDSFDLEIVEKIGKIKDLFSTDTKNQIYALIQNSSGITTQVIGQNKYSLIEDNYHVDVLNDFNFFIAEFNKPSPNGRIVILDGIPGTGKTHLIRAMFDKLNVIFLIVQANLISQLDGPQLLPTLLNLATLKKPIVIVVEDGDQILAPRKSDNMSAISSLLNLSDGIMGSLLDLRIVVTTNSNVKEMDEAILRPGRLCKRINVGLLDYDQSNKIYQKLTESTESLPKQKFFTLAEIYDLSKNKETVNIKNHTVDKKVIGFTHAPISASEDLKKYFINKIDKT